MRILRLFFSPQGQKQRDIYGWAEKNGVVGTLVED